MNIDKYIAKIINPKTILAIAQKTRKYIVILALTFLAVGLYDALIISPPDYQQGEAVRIMYVHVPAAWMALTIYSLIFILSISTLVWSNNTSYYLAISAAPVGAFFTAICLITGSLWGKPIWGAWWVWDARLTSMLILLFIYLGYISLVNHFQNNMHGIKLVSVLGIIGFINIPIIKFSVDLWNSLHQPASILRKGGIALDPSMLRPLLIMYISYIMIFILIWLINSEKNLINNKIDRLLG